MVDLIYNAIRRPVANDPEQKDKYRVDRTAKDSKPKTVDDDDAKEGKSQKQMIESYGERDEEKDQDLEQRLAKDKPQGKGKYRDKDGKEHLDIFV